METYGALPGARGGIPGDFISCSPFEVLFDLVAEAVIVTDPMGFITRTNLAFSSVFGYSPEEVVGMNIKHLYEETVPVSGRDPGVPETFETTVRHKTGALHRLSSSVTRLNDPVGGHSLLYVHRSVAGPGGEGAPDLCNADLEQKVTERTGQLARTVELLQEEICQRWQAQEAVQKAARLYETVCETNQAIIRAVDRHSLFDQVCRVLVDNGFPLAWIGEVEYATGVVRPVAAAGGGSSSLLEKVISLEDKEFNPVVTAVLNGNCCITNAASRGGHHAHTLVANGAGVRDFLAAASFALKLDGEIIGALTIYAGEENFFAGTFVSLLERLSADISFALENLDRESRRKEAEKALQMEVVERLRMMEELRRQEQLLMHQSRQAAMGEMIGNIAHQWRQPLNTLGLIVQELSLNYDVGLFDKAYLDRSIAKSMKLIAHMSQTIDDFRNFFRPTKGKVDFRVSQVVTNAISLMEGSFKNLRITIVVESIDDVTLTSYPNEFAQVLLSILSNARDALAGTAPENPLVTIRLFKEGDKMVVTIADNAGGIPEEIIGKIFDPYFSTKGAEQGTGVGLFMAKSIVEKSMMGSLTVKNSGDGAEFRIEI